MFLIQFSSTAVAFWSDLCVRDRYARERPKQIQRWCMKIELCVDTCYDVNTGKNIR